MTTRHVYKDEILVQLAYAGNVARFVSFGPNGVVRYAIPHVAPWARVIDAVSRLLAVSASGAVNVRTFRPESPEGNPFIFGLTDAEEAAAVVLRHLEQGYHVIVNETIHLNDGGIGGGVSQDGIVELVPGATPRGVETGDPATLPAGVATELVRIVFGVDISPAIVAGERTEFSVHPYRCGTRGDSVLLWERRPVESHPVPLPRVAWPNALSRFLGDKAYGLLMAHMHGARVPRTTVVGRNVAPFTFGEPTGEPRRWFRAVPAVKLPGELPTFRHWADPFTVASDCGDDLLAILSQDDVPAEYAGAALVTPDRVTVEGTAGYGDAFMLGDQPAQELPEAVEADVATALGSLREHFGTFSAEWVYAAGQAWVVQVNQLTAAESGGWTEADAAEWVTFDATDGIEALRALLDGVGDRGVRVLGAVGITSHIGDILRRSGVPHVFGA